jgi:hypothetical protein
MVFMFYTVFIEVKRKVENKYILSLIKNEPGLYRKTWKKMRGPQEKRVWAINTNLKAI